MSGCGRSSFTVDPSSLRLTGKGNLRVRSKAGAAEEPLKIPDKAMISNTPGKGAGFEGER